MRARWPAGPKTETTSGRDRNDTERRLRNAGRVKTQIADPERTTDEPVDVVVTFAGRSGPVAGTVSGGPSGVASPFHGWLELMDALESTRSGAHPGSGMGEGAVS
jgi:hypothetical protein